METQNLIDCMHISNLYPDGFTFTEGGKFRGNCRTFSKNILKTEGLDMVVI